MKKLINPVSAILAAMLVGIFIGYFVSNKSQSTQTTKVENSKPIVIKTEPHEFSLKKGGVYVKQFNLDSNDPFAVSVIDTITVLDFQSSSKNSDLIYVKWTFNKWNDSSRFISSELSYLAKNMKELK